MLTWIVRMFRKIQYLIWDSRQSYVKVKHEWTNKDPGESA